MLSYNRILTYLIFTASIGCGQNSTTDSTLFQWIESQVELSNIWKWEDALPDFVANPQFQRQYYPDISEFGGLGQVAIIEKISNKNILLRIITGCEKQIDVPVSQSVSLNEINFAENSLFDYYYHKNLRSIAEDRFKRLFTTKNLGENIDSMNVDVSGCDELTARIINGYKHLKSSDRTLIKGFFYTIVTRSGEKGTVVFSSDSIQNNQSDSIFLFEIKRLIDKQLNKARGEIHDVDPLIQTLRAEVSNQYEDHLLVYNFVGPYFESNINQFYEKMLYQLAKLESNGRRPFLKSYIVHDVVGVVYLEESY